MLRFILRPAVAVERLGSRKLNAARRAFTLIEVLVTLVLIGVLATVLWINVSATQHAEDLPESARRMKGMISMCRAQAMGEGRRYRLRVHRDGTLDVTRQLDPLIAPHLNGVIRADWANIEMLIGDVWIESVQPMPEGPPPLNVEDDKLDLTKYDEGEPTPVAEMERALEIWFEPDGTSSSVRWTLRHVEGSGIRMLLDGRLGRITADSADWANARGRPQRPEPISSEERMTGIVEDEAQALEQYRREDQL